MDEFHTYQIEVQNRTDENDLNAGSPIQVAKMAVDSDTTRFTVHTDQSGLIGLLRHLHGRGFMLLSVQYEQNE